MIPSAAQGAIAIASKKDNLDLNKILNSISCKKTFHCVQQERNFLKIMDGGCSSPISSFAKMNGKNLTFEVGITCMEGKKSIQIKEDFDNDPEAYLKIYKLLMKKGELKFFIKLKSNGKN